MEKERKEQSHVYVSSEAHLTEAVLTETTTNVTLSKVKQLTPWVNHLHGGTVDSESKEESNATEHHLG